MEKRLIVFTDCGDTIVDESTQVFDERGIVTNADFIPGADKVLDHLYQEGYPLALVADGETESFQNIFRPNRRWDYFKCHVISQEVGIQKPAQIMFETALNLMNLKEEDKKRIVMIGNNLKKDIAGANRFGITSIWLSWSPRYFHKVEEPDWLPDYTVQTPDELIQLLDYLNDELT